MVAARSLGDGGDRDKCRALLKHLNQDFGAVKMGATMVLYRSPEHRVLELLRNLALEKLVPKAQRGARAGMGRRYLAVLKRVKADLKTLLASPRANDAKALDRAVDAAQAALHSRRPAGPGGWPGSPASTARRRRSRA